MTMHQVAYAAGAAARLAGIYPEWGSAFDAWLDTDEAVRLLVPRQISPVEWKSLELSFQNGWQYGIRPAAAPATPAATLEGVR